MRPLYKKSIQNYTLAFSIILDKKLIKVCAIIQVSSFTEKKNYDQLLQKNNTNNETLFANKSSHKECKLITYNSWLSVSFIALHLLILFFYWDIKRLFK